MSTYPLDGLDGVLHLEEVAVGGEDRDGAVVPICDGPTRPIVRRMDGWMDCQSVWGGIRTHGGGRNSLNRNEVEGALHAHTHRDAIVQSCLLLVVAEAPLSVSID